MNNFRRLPLFRHWKKNVFHLLDVQGPSWWNQNDENFRSIAPLFAPLFAPHAEPNFCRQILCGKYFQKETTKHNEQRFPVLCSEFTYGPTRSTGDFPVFSWSAWNTRWPLNPSGGHVGPIPKGHVCLKTHPKKRWEWTKLRKLRKWP